MSIESDFPSAEAMEQVLAMGMEEGLTQAVGQIDAILAEGPGELRGGGCTALASIVGADNRAGSCANSSRATPPVEARTRAR